MTVYPVPLWGIGKGAGDEALTPLTNIKSAVNFDREYN
jgi:hypothetical protein